MRTHADYIVDFLAICITRLSGQAIAKRRSKVSCNAVSRVSEVPGE